MSESLRPHGLQHARLLCPPLSPGMHACLVSQLCLTSCHPTDCSPSGSSVHGILQARALERVAITVSWSWVKFMSTKLVMLSNHIILYCPLLLPSIFPSIRVFSEELVLHIRWPKYWSFSFSISPSNEYSRLPLGLTGLIFFQSTVLLRVFFSTTVQKRQFFGTQSSLWSSSHIRTWLLWKPQLWPYGPSLAQWCLCFLICCLGLSCLSFQGVSVF